MTKSKEQFSHGSFLENKLSQLEKEMRAIRTKQLNGSDTLAPNMASSALSSDHSLTTAGWEDVGLSVTFTLAEASSLLVYAIFGMDGDGVSVLDVIEGRLDVDGTPESEEVFGPFIDGDEIWTLGQVYQLDLAAGSRTLKLQARNTDSRGVINTHTTLTYIIYKTT